MYDSRSRTFLALAFGVLALAGVSACSEDLGSGAACPALCPDQNVETLETVIEPVILDTTLIGLPPLGSSGRLYIASRGDTVETYGVVRFDVLTRRFRPAVDDTTTAPIAEVRGATVRILTDTLRRIVNAPITLELYDVDTTAADTNTAAVAALIRPERLIGSVTLPADTSLDTLRIPISEEALLAKIADSTRLRIAIGIRSDLSAQLLVVGLAAVADATRLTYTPVSAEGVEGAELTVAPRSTTPAESPAAAAQLADYLVVARGSPPVPSTELAVGGLPNRRSYLRFDIPASIIDSSTVIRATLVLTQQPTTGVAADDTIGVYPYIVTAGSAVTDLSRVALLITPGSLFGLDSLAVVPSDTGEVSLDIVGLVRAWRLQSAEDMPRALVLRTSLEATQPTEVRFFSSDAAASLRPRLRLTYIPRTDFGLP